MGVEYGGEKGSCSASKCSNFEVKLPLSFFELFLCLPETLKLFHLNLHENDINNKKKRLQCFGIRDNKFANKVKFISFINRQLQ